MKKFALAASAALGLAACGGGGGGSADAANEIEIVGSSTGGDAGRKLEFWPVSGRARQYALTGAEAQRTVQQEARPVAPPKPVESSIEFF